MNSNDKEMSAAENTKKPWVAPQVIASDTLSSAQGGVNPLTTETTGITPYQS